MYDKHYGGLTVIATSFTKFKQLGHQFRAMQLTLLSTACPESMDLKGLVSWGNLASQTIAYSYKIQDNKANAHELREHWGELKDNAIAQLERVAKSMLEYIETAEELTAWERCQLVGLASTVSRTFQDESDLILKAMSEQGQLNSVPAAISTETLAKLAQL
jgi:hypothetical protein